MEAYSYAYYGLAAVFLIYYLYRFSRIGMRSKNAPPGMYIFPNLSSVNMSYKPSHRCIGPPTLPLIGNVSKNLLGSIPARTHFSSSI